MIIRYLAALLSFLVIFSFGSVNSAYAGVHKPSAISISSVQADTSMPIVVSHRTAMNYAPENTVAGIYKSADLGATWVEMDVRWNASNFTWLMHDGTVDRTTNGTGALSSLYYGAIRQLWAADYAPWNNATLYPQYVNKKDADGNQVIRPPYAYEFLWAGAQRNMNLLLHVQTTPTKAQADNFVNYLHRSEFGNLEARSIYMASADSIKAFKSFYPNEPLKYYMIDYPTDGVMRTATYLKSFGANGYVVPIDASITPSFVQYYHDNGLALWSWTSVDGKDNVASWKQLADAGVDAVISNEFPSVISCYADYVNC